MKIKEYDLEFNRISAKDKFVPMTASQVYVPEIIKNDFDDKKAMYWVTDE